jgi:hypothetical protein
VKGVETIRIVGQLEGEFELKGKRECLTVVASIGSKEPQGWSMLSCTVGDRTSQVFGPIACNIVHGRFRKQTNCHLIRPHFRGLSVHPLPNTFRGPQKNTAGQTNIPPHSHYELLEFAMRSRSVSLSPVPLQPPALPPHMINTSAGRRHSLQLK